MRTPLCSLALTSDSLPRMRHCAAGLGEALGLAPVPLARWLTAVSVAARAALQAGSAGTLTLLLDEDSAECAGPAVAAEIRFDAKGALAGEGVLEPDPAALARAAALVDHLAVTPGTVATMFTLESSLPGSAPTRVDAALRAAMDQLLEQPLPVPAQALAQQDEDTFTLLAAADAAQMELAAARSAHAEALARLAHDIRSPLLTLNLSLEMLRLKPHTPAELEERRELMKRQADQLKALATGLLQAAGPHHGGTADEGTTPR